MHADPSPGLHSRTARAWLWAGLWGLFVWGLGGEELSSASTSRFLGPMIRWLLAGISYADSQLLQFYIRKTAHAVEYALLAVLILRALRTGRRPTLIGASLAALGLATAFAAADETRQSLSTVRMGSVFDVALDGTGAAVGIGLLLLFWSRAGPPRVGQATRSRGSEKAASADDMHTGTSE